MKKVVLTLSAFALVAMFAACGGPAADGKKLAEKRCECKKMEKGEDKDKCKEERDKMEEEMEQKYKDADEETLQKFDDAYDEVMKNCKD